MTFITDTKFRNVKKMTALFVIDREKHIATDDVNPDALWLFTEAAIPTIKRDGTSITVTEDGTVFARRAVKKGKTAPEGFILAEEDAFTGHKFGLEPIENSGFRKMFTEAAARFGGELPPGTFELCGPKINGNPEKLDAHELFIHGTEIATTIPDMTGVKPEDVKDVMRPLFAEFAAAGIEGVVWAGADGKRVKLRVKDFTGDPNRR